MSAPPIRPSRRLIAIRAALGLAVGLDLWAIIVLRPGWSTLLRNLAHPAAWIDRVGTDAAGVAVFGCALWLAALWLGVGLAAALLTALPGLLGRVAGATARRLLPGLLVRITAGAAGLSVLAAPALAGASTPNITPGFTPAPGASSTAPSWPLDHPQPGAAVPWPSDPPASTPARPDSALTPASTSTSTSTEQLASPNQITVRPGDSLWALAARSLPPGATAAQVAASWPALYAANRPQIGSNPALIHPGQILQASPPPSGSAGPT
jgi:LysM repeat protein